MSEGAKAVRLVVSRPLQQLRNSIPRFPFGGGGASTTSRPRQSRPQKQVHDLSEVHYHYDDFGNRIENPKEYLKQFKQSISHSHSHIGDASSLPDNIIKELELKEELKFEKDVDSGNAFSSSYEFGKMPSFQSNFQNNQFNSFGGFDSSHTTTHNDDWKPMSKPKPASSLHTQVNSFGGSDNHFGSSTNFLKNRPITNYRSVKHYDSDRPSTSYSFHHFASPEVDYGVDTKAKDSVSFGSFGSSSNKVSKTQNFDHFFDYYDHKFNDHHVSESQIQSVSEKSTPAQEKIPEAAALVQKPITTTTTTTTTTPRPITTTRTKHSSTTRHTPRTPAKHHRDHNTGVSTERPNYPEYFFQNPAKPEAQKPKFMRTVRDEEDLFKGSLLPPAKFVPHTPKFPTIAKEPVHIVMAQPVHDKASLKAKEKFRKQVEAHEKKPGSYSLRKRYPATRLPAKPEQTTATPTTSVPSPVPTVVNTVAQVFTEGYAQNEVAPAEIERKYPKKYMTVETTTARTRAKPAAESARPNRGSLRARGSVKFGARL